MGSSLFPPQPGLSGAINRRKRAGRRGGRCGRTRQGKGGQHGAANLIRRPGRARRRRAPTTERQAGCGCLGRGSAGESVVPYQKSSAGSPAAAGIVLNSAAVATAPATARSPASAAAARQTPASSRPVIPSARWCIRCLHPRSSPLQNMGGRPGLRGAASGFKERAPRPRCSGPACRGQAGHGLVLAGGACRAGSADATQGAGPFAASPAGRRQCGGICRRCRPNGGPGAPKRPASMSIPAPARKSWQRLSPPRKSFLAAPEKKVCFFSKRGLTIRKDRAILIS